MLWEPGRITWKGQSGTEERPWEPAEAMGNCKEGSLGEEIAVLELPW